jgi:cation:H+ antiporter
MFALGLMLLIISGSWAIKSLDRIGGILHLSQFTLGFVLMAFATNLPEIFVAMNAVGQNQVELSFGNLIGSNIVNLGLILGVVYILSYKQAARNRFTLDLALNLFIIAVILLFLLDGAIVRMEGLVLLMLFGLRIFILYKDKDQVSGMIESTHNVGEIFKQLFLFGLAIAIMIGSAYILVGAGTRIAQELGVSPFVVGLLGISLGTTLPELVFSIQVVLQKKTVMAVGNLLGSALINLTLILGSLTVVQPIQLSGYSPNFSIIILAVIGGVLLLADYQYFKNKLLLGMLLLIIYATYVIGEIYQVALIGG